MDDAARNLLKAVLQPMQDAQRERSERFEPGDSYWYYRPTLDFPPRALHDPDDYAGGARLAISGGPTTLSASKRSALMKAWCRRLPSLSSVRVLWIPGKASQAIFEAACAMPALEGLHVKWSGITSLAPLAGHGRLSHFHLGGAPSATGLEALRSLPRLVDLELHNIRAAGDLSFLEGLSGLRSLDLAGDGNSIKPLKIATLAPLATLAGLERLWLTTVRVEEPSLAPLAGLPKLRHLRLANVFPMAECARLAGLRPDLEFNLATPTGGATASLSCKRCRQRLLHMTTGQGVPWLCEACDGPRLARHVAEFEAIRAAAAAG